MTQPISAGISLASGAKFNYFEPCEIHIEDLAQNLASIPRFLGSTTPWHPVAMHCVNGSYIVPEELAFDFLMHDTSEAVTGDITTPLKHYLGSSFKELESSIEAKLSKQFGFTYPLSPEIKQADLQMLVLENHYLRGGRPMSGVDIDAVDISYLHPLVEVGVIHFGAVSRDTAMHLFLNRYEELKP